MGSFDMYVNVFRIWNIGRKGIIDNFEVGEWYGESVGVVLLRVERLGWGDELKLESRVRKWVDLEVGL